MLSRWPSTLKSARRPQPSPVCLSWLPFSLLKVKSIALRLSPLLGPCFHHQSSYFLENTGYVCLSAHSSPLWVFTVAIMLGLVLSAHSPMGKPNSPETLPASDHPLLRPVGWLTVGKWETLCLFLRVLQNSVPPSRFQLSWQRFNSWPSPMLDCALISFSPAVLCPLCLSWPDARWVLLLLFLNQGFKYFSTQ